MPQTLYQYYQSLGQALPSWQERIPIAQQAGISGYTGTAPQNIQLLNWLQSQQQQQQLQPNIPANIPADITPVTPDVTPIIGAGELGTTGLTVPPPQTSQQLLSYYQQLAVKPIEAPEQAKVTEYETQLQNLLQQYTGQTAYQEQLRTEAGVTGMEQELLDMQNLIRQKEQSLRAGLEQVGGQPIPMQFITGQQAAMKRQAAIELEALTASYEVKRGNLQLAYDKVDRMLKLKYEPIREQIELTKQLLDINYDKLSKSEKRIADQRKLELDLYETQIKEAIKREEEEEKLRINPGEYTEGELRKLRAAGIKATDVTAADAFLYPEKEAEEEKLLSPSESAILGVPYGTTRAQAAQMGITPERYKPTEPKPEPTGLAKDYFKEAQLATGAFNAGMTIKDFGNLSVDEANKYIQKVPTPAISQLKSNFLKYLTDPASSGKTTKELKKEAQMAGLDPNDTAILEAIKKRSVGGFRRMLGY